MKNQVLDDVSVVILAAGYSSRMKSPKALVEIQNGVTFLDTLIETYTEFGCGHIYVVVNSEIYDQLSEQYKNETLSFILNQHPGYERFYSAQTGLRTCKTKYCYLQNVDNPGTKESTLLELYRKKQNNAYIVPVFDDKGGHPILLGPEIIQGIKDLKGHDYNLRQVLQAYKRINVKVEEGAVHQNINSKEELLRYIQDKGKR